MKTLKFDHQTAQSILEGKKTSTWRLYDDKDLSVNDDIKVIDKVDPEHDSSWQVIGRARVKQIIEKQLNDVTKDDMRGHIEFRSSDEMLTHYRNLYGERVDLNTPVKIVQFSFEPGSMDAPVEASKLEEARVYTDGGSRGNPGPSACAYVICNLDDNVVEKSGFYLGKITNNQAEYQGLVMGLERASELDIKNLSVFMDSELVVNQVNGFYKVKNADLAPFYQKVSLLAKGFQKISFTHVPRELNRIADAEVNRILDEQKNH
jgi:ribonuclease HI